MSRILLVDDDIEFLDTFQSILIEKSYEVETVSNTDGIFLKIINFKPDVIILDVNLEGFDGRNICNGLKNHPKTENLPIILISGDHTYRNSYQKCKAEEFVSKPIDLNLISSLIDKYATSQYTL